MFGKEKIQGLQEEIRILQNYLEDEKAKHDRELKRRDLIEEFNKAKEVKALTAKVVELEKELAVVKKEKEVFEKLIDVNGDIIDVKDLITKLIDKLPEININSLSLTTSNKK